MASIKHFTDMAIAFAFGNAYGDALSFLDTQAFMSHADQLHVNRLFYMVQLVIDSSPS
jgi:hypothetical protein